MKFKSLLLATVVFAGTINAAPAQVAKPADAVVATTSLITRAKDAVNNAAKTTYDAVAAVPGQVKTGYKQLVDSKCVQAQVKFVQKHKVVVAVTAAVAAALITYAVYKSKNQEKKN